MPRLSREFVKRLDIDMMLNMQKNDITHLKNKVKMMESFIDKMWSRNVANERRLNTIEENIKIN
jgi:hypothetical protein